MPGVCSDDGNVADCGVGSGDGRGFVEAAAAMALAEAEEMSADEVAVDAAALCPL